MNCMASELSHLMARRPNLAAIKASLPNRTSLTTVSTARNRGRFTLSAPDARTNARERKRRRHDAQQRDRGGAFLFDFRFRGLEPLRGNVAGDSALADFFSHPQRHRSAEHRSGRRDQRVQPRALSVARDEQNDRSIDTERKPEEHRRFRRRQHEQSARREEYPRQGSPEYAHADLRSKSRAVSSLVSDAPSCCSSRSFPPRRRRRLPWQSGSGIQAPCPRERSSRSKQYSSHQGRAS